MFGGNKIMQTLPFQLWKLTAYEDRLRDKKIGFKVFPLLIEHQATKKKKAQNFEQLGWVDQTSFYLKEENKKWNKRFLSWDEPLIHKPPRRKY